MNKKICMFLLVGLTAFLGFAEPFFDPSIQKELIIIDSVHDYDLNPQTSNYSSEAQLLTGLYEGLFSYDPLTLEPLPAIAEGFRVSRDKKTWTFNIRENAKFSNGEQITAEDVYRSWIELLNPELDAPFASHLDCIEGAADYRLGHGNVEDVGISVGNDNTLIVKLISPTDHFSKILCHHAFAIVAEDENVYSGPYVLKERSDDMVVFEKNTEYYDADNVAIPSIRIINNDDTDENSYSFNVGDVQWATGGVVIEKIYDAESFFIAPQFGTEFFFFKAGKTPWDNPILRNAVLAAIPWEKLRAGNWVIATTLLYPLSGYPEVIGSYEQDINLAKELLEEAGYDTQSSDDEDGVIDTGLELVFAIPDYEHVREKAEIVVDALAEIGITVLIETTPGPRYLGSFDGWDADLFTYTWIGDFADPLAFLELFRGGSSLRETEWQDDHFDNLLEEAAFLTDSEERYEKLAEAEQYLLDEGVILPISHPISFNVVDTSVLGGWYPNALNIHPFKYLYFLQPVADDSSI